MLTKSTATRGHLRMKELEGTTYLSEILWALLDSTGLILHGHFILPTRSHLFELTEPSKQLFEVFFAPGLEPSVESGGRRAL